MSHSNVSSSNNTPKPTSSFSPSNPAIAAEPVWSSAATPECRSAGLQNLVGGGGGGGGGGGKWALSRTRDGLERRYVFAGFGKAMRFVGAVADECKRRRHHPEWANVYNVVRVRWTTHNPPGLSDKDVEMARFCDGVAAEIGLKEEDSKPTAAAGEDILDSLAGECTPCGGKTK